MRRLPLLILLFSLSVMGCQQGEAHPDQLHGKVTFKDHPAPFTTIVVKDGTGKTAGGSTNDKGEYLIPNPPKGALKFQFIVAGDKKGAAIPAKYAKGENDIALQYEGGKKEFNIDLKP